MTSVGRCVGWVSSPNAFSGRSGAKSNLSSAIVLLAALIVRPLRRRNCRSAPVFTAAGRSAGPRARATPRRRKPRARCRAVRGSLAAEHDGAGRRPRPPCSSSAGSAITGSTVYTPRAACAAVRGPDRQARAAAGGLRSRAAHHRQIRRRRLRAVARDRAAAGTRAVGRGHPHRGGRGLCRQRSNGRSKLARYRDFFTDYAAQDHRRPAGQHPHARALSAARQRSAGPEVHHQARSVEDRARALRR